MSGRRSARRLGVSWDRARVDRRGLWRTRWGTLRRGCRGSRRDRRGGQSGRPPREGRGRLCVLGDHARATSAGDRRDPSAMKWLSSAACALKPKALGVIMNNSEVDCRRGASGDAIPNVFARDERFVDASARSLKSVISGRSVPFPANSVGRDVPGKDSIRSMGSISRPLKPTSLGSAPRLRHPGLPTENRFARLDCPFRTRACVGSFEGTRDGRRPTPTRRTHARASPPAFVHSRYDVGRF